MSSAAFYLEALHAVVPPVILVRLLQHRFLGTMHIRRGAPSRTSIASENRSRAGSSAGNEDSLRVRRRVTLTINCSSPARAASTSAEERRDSVRPPEKQVTVVPPENVVGPSLSPEHSSPAGRRAFKFSSLKKRVSKVVATTQDQNSSSLQTTSEADIVAFQKELQNLPNFESQVGSGGLYSDGGSGTGGGVSDLCHLRPRSCSVPRVTFEAASLQLPHSHGPLIRSATTEGAYTCSPVNKASSAQQPQPPQTLLSACETAAPAHGGGSCELPGAHLTILRLLQEWACKCPGDLRSREFRDFLNRLACMGDPYQWWAEELRVSVDMKEERSEAASPPSQLFQEDRDVRLRDRVLNGELPVGKDEASILAGVQLRIEESWPSNARSPSALPSDHLGKLIPISEDAKESVIAELPGTAEGSRMSSGDADDSHNDSSDSGGGGDGTGGSGGGTPTSTCRLSGRFARAVPKRRSLILRPFMGSEGNKSPTMAHNTKYKDCLPPAYHSTKNMIKTIKEQRRKLFHSPLYESEIHLKKLYIQTCKRLPVYGCRLFQVKELLRGKTKKRANRVLAIGIEKIVLLDDKTLAVSKWQDTAELLQWRTGGGRAHDRLVLEFRGSKWAFVATHSLRSISTVLWEIMQDLDARFLDEQLITTREELDKESHKNMVSLYGMERVIVYKEELEKLQTLLHFPEEMALRLTNVEYELFYSVDPVHYIRQVTVDLSGKAGAAIPKGHENTVQTLIARFNEVSSWVTHIIISQPTHDDRKAVLSCILRIAMSCWNIGNFNAAMEILAGLKQKLKPFWLSLSDKDQLPVLDFLSQALLNPEPSKEYREAVQRALNIPHSKVVPFFGTFLRELRAILQGMPSLIVLPSEGARSIEFVADYHGEDHFMTRIGVGGIINVEKMDEAHRVLDEIKAFHHHHKCRKHATAQVAINSQEARRDGCGSSRAEDESLYMQDLAAYIPIQGLKHNHDVSLIPLQVDTVDFHELQILHHGCTIVHWEEDGSRSVLCYARLESHNGTITWCRPTWSALQVSGPRDYSLSANIEECVPIGVVQKCETGESYQAGLEEGFVDLHIVKEIVLCRSSIEVAAVARRHGLEDSIYDQNLLRIKFGTGLSENRVLEFILPGTLAEVWYKSIRRLVAMLKQQRQLCDSRIYWLKETFLQLYYNEQNCSGPTAFESIKAFGGRKWSASWVAGSNAVEASAFKRASSFGMSTNKLRKKKSSSSMVPFKDDNAIFVFDIDEGPPRKPSPTVKKRRATVKSSPQMRSQESSPQRLSVSRSSSSCENLNRVDGGVPVVQPIPQTAGDRPCHDSRDPMSTSALLNRLVITSGSRLTFSSFVELFRSFMVHARRDIFALFCAMATVYSFSTDEARKAAADRSSKSTAKALGLITRGTKYGCPDPDQDKIFHVVSSSSASTDPDQPEVSKSPVMEPSVFQKFLETQQGEILTETEVIKLIQRHEPNDLLRKHGRLSFEGFARYLMDKDNFAFVPETISPELDDMDYPMAYYYIASSHNTYLTGHQLKGESSVELYSEVLLRGCRCVELDCWDGDDGIPVIYHGHTLTSKIPFKSVVEAIEKSCFANSPYPIILSIENHCSLQQQAKMAQIFASVFGDKLVTNFLFESDYLDDPHLPSPNQLKYKVLIKNKKLRAPLTPALPFKTKSFQQVKNAPGRTNSIISTASTGSLNDDDDDEYDEDDDDDDVLEESLSSQEGSFKDSRTLSPGTSHPRSRNHADLDLFYSDDDGYKQRKSSSQIAPELSDLVVYCQAIKFRGFVTGASPTNSVKVKKMSSRKNVLGAAGSPLGPSTPPQCSELKSEQILPKRPLASAMCHQVSSINESAAKRLCKPLLANMVSLTVMRTHCDNQLMRTYPAGMRIDSSNFNPVIFWAFGLQMVALNYQTEDAGLHVNAAMFEQNGSCGYVLKPRVMWDRSHMMYGRFNPWDKDFDALHALRLQIKVISGQFLCPNACICSTQVEIEVIGIPVDCNRQKTSIVQRNSFNPSWGTIFNFRVTFPDLAFLRFTVVDVTTSHLLSQRVIPLKSLKQGYRHIRLRSPQNQPLSLATLFVHSTWEEEFVEVPKNGEAGDSGARKNKAKLKDLAESSQREGKDNSLGSTVRTKRRMFFLVVHGVVPDEKKTILKTSQDSTSRDVIAQALHKANKAHESVDNYVLMEEVQKSWDKRQQEKSTTQRILEDDECPLMAQSRWQGDGRFILKKVADDPSTRAWMTTIKSSSNKERRKQDSELGETGLSEWNAGDETYLVCVYNVSSDQPYAILKAPISSTAQDIIAQALVKARRAEDPNNFVLVEEVEYPSTTTESTPLGSSVRRRGPYRDRRVLYDHENVYEVQAQWTAKGLFELRDRNEVTLEQRRGNAPKSSSFYRLSRLRSSMKSKERDKSCPSPKQSPDSSLRHSEPVACQEPGPSQEICEEPANSGRRQVHSEGETLSDDETQEPPSAVSRLRKISFRKLKVWR
ncbi:unnamed protein product [Ixodes persulcatus]